MKLHDVPLPITEGDTRMAETSRHSIAKAVGSVRLRIAPGPVLSRLAQALLVARGGVS